MYRSDFGLYGKNPGHVRSFMINEQHLLEMDYITKRAWCINSCWRTIVMSLLEGGVALFRGQDMLSEDVIGPLLQRWLDIDWPIFITRAFPQLAGLGILICAVDESTMELMVVNPLDVHITAHVDEFSRMRYAVQSKMGDGSSYVNEWGHDDRFMVFAMFDFDERTGRSTGLFSQSQQYYAQIESLLQSLEMTVTNNAITTAWVESTGKGDATNSWQQYEEMGMRNPRLRDVTSTEAMMAKRQEIAEDLYMQRIQRTRAVLSTVDATAMLPGVDHHLRPRRINPSSVAYVPVEPNAHIHERAPLPYNRDIVQQISTLEDVIRDIWGVPSRSVVKAMRESSAAADFTEKMMQHSALAYVGPLTTVMEGVSHRVFRRYTIARAGRILLSHLTSRIGSEMIEEPDKLTQTLRKDVERSKQEARSPENIVCVHFVSVAPQRVMHLLYDNFVLRDDVYKRYLRRTMYASMDMFNPEDARLLRAKMEIAIKSSGGSGGGTDDHRKRGVGGPGRDGEGTLSQGVDQIQVQNRNPMSSSARSALGK